MNTGHTYLAGTFLFLLTYIAFVIDHVGVGDGEFVTGYGLPVILFIMLALSTALPSVTEKVENHAAKAVLNVIGQLIQIGSISGTLGSLAQFLVWHGDYCPKGFFTGSGWLLVFPIPLITTVAVFFAVGLIGKQKVDFVAATFSFFIACAVFTIL